MRRRVQQRSENSSTTFTATAKRKGGMIALVFVILNLVCRVRANFPCKPEQIHWNNTRDRRYKCLDCPDCPAGSQPSIACGTSVKYGTPVDCVLCELGKTFSDKYDNAQCMSCTICSQGKAVKKNCTLSMNTECDDKCGHEFYTAHLISGCLPCTQCCDDEKDELTKECMNSNKKCKMRFTPCLRVGTTPSRPSEQIFHLNTLPTAQTTTSIESEILTTQVNTVDKSVSGKFSSSITPTRSLNNEALITKAADSGKQDGISIINITVIMFMVVLALCLLLSANRFRHIRRSSREQNSSSNGGNDTARGRAPPRPCFSVINQPSQEPPSPPLNRSESPQANGSDSPELNDSASPQTDGSESPRPSENVSPQANETAPSQSNGSVSSQAIRAASHHSEPRGSVLVKSSQFSQEQVKANPGDVTLEELEEKHFPVFERMCKELNNRIPGERWDFERLASCYERISLLDRNSLINEFQNGRGSPSDVLMRHIKAKYPDYQVRHLVWNLQSIERNDVAQRLMPYITGKPSSK